MGRAYLMSHGVPSEAIIVETEGESTVESTAMAGEIMRRMGLHSAIVVSDGYHIYRVKKMLHIERHDRVRLAAQGTQPRFPARELELRQAGHGLSAVARRSGLLRAGYQGAVSRSEMRTHASKLTRRSTCRPSASRWRTWP